MAIQMADFAGLLRQEVEKVAFESYDAEESKIPLLFETIPFDQAPKKIYWTESVAARDTKLQKREPGEDVKQGSSREGRIIPYRWKFFAHRIQVPDEFVMFAAQAPAGMVSDNMADSVLDHIRPQARWVGQERARREEEYAADLFNQGGLNAGHEVFDQSVPGVFADANGDLCYDGYEFFNLTGDARSALDGSTYYNGDALALSATNAKTMINLAEDTNAYDEMGRRVSIAIDTLLVPKALRHTADEIISARALAGTANNDANSLRDLDVVTWSFLTDTNAWFVGQRQRGIRWYEGGPLTVKVGENVESLSTGIAVQAKWAVNVNDWRYWAGSNFSTS